MKYFCPFENVKTIDGRNNSNIGVDTKSTNINGWEIAENGIWAGGKDTKSESPKGVRNLGVFTQNWSIDSEGNISAKEGTFSDKLSVLGTSFFVGKTDNNLYDVIRLDNFELIKNNNTNTLTLFGKHTKNSNESQTIVTVNEEESGTNYYFQLDYNEGIKVPYLTIKNANNAIISGDINGYLNLNNNLKLSKNANYTFYQNSFSRSPDGTLSYTYTLPNKGGEVAIIKEGDPQCYSYSIEIEKGFYLGSSAGDHYTESEILLEINTLTMITNETNKTFIYSMDEEINGKLNLYQIRIEYTSNKTINKISFSIAYPTHPDLTNNKDRDQNQWNKFIVYRHDIFGRKTKFIYNVTTGKWEEQA